jgi:hypothetical protein
MIPINLEEEETRLMPKSFAVKLGNSHLYI